ncbi:hypothetical protein C2G38_2139186 [Gigaspora rosea]|uniref:Uncharacterized protein n=1 Tax=Gigaspora rosea TaxID=44941 RepID=A0A397VQ42_9GLOM|nr:hypothetical protein C2G38_2139186 [Gigaspora rosea]
MIRVNKFLAFNRIAAISNKRLFQTTTIYRQEPHISSDQPRHSGSKEENPQRTSPTYQKPTSEGHAINKAKGALGVMVDTATSATEKVKDVFTRMTTPSKALDTQAEAVAKGLQDNTQQLKDKGQENLEYAKDKGQDSLKYAKDKGQDSWEYAKDKGQDCWEYAKDKGQDCWEYAKDKGQEGWEYAKDKGYDAVEGVKAKGREIMSDVNTQGIKEKGQSLVDEGKKAAGIDSSSRTSDSQRDSKERLANPETIDRHPKKPGDEIRQSVQDVVDATKQKQ